MLIGTGNATDSYSFSDADNDKEGISVIAQADRNKQDSYGKFNFTDTDGDKAVWKIYEGKNGQDADGTPLLKVFLTKAEYTGGTGFTYNGQGQGLSLDGVTVDGKKLSDVAKTLLSALTGKNAYDGYLGFSSEQIAASGEGNSFNPNNLGLRHRRNLQYQKSATQRHARRHQPYLRRCEYHEQQYRNRQRTLSRRQRLRLHCISS